MANLKIRIAQLEKSSVAGGPLLIYDSGSPSDGREMEATQAEASGRAVIRVSPIDAAL